MPSPLLTTALEMHQSGHLGRAAQAYEQILASERENADALHLLGVVRFQQNQPRESVELIRRAVILRPSVPAYHSNLAEAYRALGEFDRAVGCCRTALGLFADYPEALNNLGLALQGLGKHAEAVEPFRRALELQPDFALAHNNLGISLRELNERDSALVHFRRAVELQPEYAPAQTNLGLLLSDLGQAEEALAHCQEAARLQPDVAAMHHNLGNVLRALERFTEARGCYLEAIRLDPTLARSHDHLGLALQKERRLADALPWLQQAVQLEPANPLFWQHLAELHTDREQPEEALACWRRVVELSPEDAFAQRALGGALQDEGHFAEALEHYQRAQQLQPDVAANAMNFGAWHEEQGNLTEAEGFFREALRLQPAFALPHARLATMLRSRLPEADQKALEDRLADPALTNAPRARLLFGLAHVLDGRGDYARAAECSRQANALTLELDRAPRPYVPADHARFVDNVRQEIGGDFFARTAGGGLPTRRPVFIIGLPRSGTTLVEQVLASHPRIHGAGELRLGRRSFEAIPTVLDGFGLPIALVGQLDAERTRRLAEQHEGWLNALDARAERIVDKMPDNYLYLGFLAALFPEAVFVHCRRDLRDVALSCWMTDFRAIPWANDVEHIATRLAQYTRLMEHWRSVLPSSRTFVEVDYEESVADLEGVARRLIAACGLDWDPACLEFHRTRRPVRTASLTQVRQPIYTRSVGRWQKYQPYLSDLFAALKAAAVEEAR